ncbi:MAG: hypothetical protein ABWZ16_05960 [Microbacterium sp.]
MLRIEVADAATVAGIVIPIIVTLLTIVGAVVAPRLSSNADDLRRAESLTTVLSAMPPSSQRDLVEQERDDLATVWALRQAAPEVPKMRALGSAAYFGGLVVLLLGVVYLLVASGYQWWFWLVYLLGVALVVLGWLVHRYRIGRRREWMSAELRRRGLPVPVDGRLRREVTVAAERADRDRA